MTDTPDKQDFSLSTMTKKEVNFAIQLAKEEGWNPGLHDANAFYSTDPHGFFIAKLNGEPIGCCSNVIYDDFFSFLGFFIVKPQFRHHGYGAKLFQHAIHYAGNRNIGLDGVLAQEKTYEKYGFKTSYKNQRFELIDIPKMNAITIPLVPLNEIRFEDLVNYDKQFFPSERPVFLKSWINQPDHYGIAIANNKLQGYAIIRPCVKGYKIGPLFADTPLIAEQLFQGLIKQIKKGPFYLDIPLVNNAAQALVKKYNMKPLFATVRMYTKKAPSMNLNGMFGVTSFELG